MKGNGNSKDSNNSNNSDIDKHNILVMIQQ